MEPTGDAIADAVHRQFDLLTPKRKPQIRSPTVREWVPLSGIVVQDGEVLECIALGTGMKCLPHALLPQARGNVLHDWHAETVAIRSLNFFLLQECKALALSGASASSYVRRRRGDEVTATHFQPFAVREEVLLHMYSSEAPCGDASMELIMAAQEDPTPWPLPSIVKEDSKSPPSPLSLSQTAAPPTTTLPGRANFSDLGRVRRKPSRPDAPVTLSKSCSDKLSLCQCTSLLLSPTSLLLSPENAYMKTFVVPSSQYTSVGFERAFSDKGRMNEMRNRKWDAGYTWKGFGVRTTEREFEFSRRQEGQTLVPSNLAVAWSLPHEGGGRGAEETLVGGVVQGRRRFDPRGASVISRRRLWGLALEVARAAAMGLGASAITRALDVQTYDKVKESALLAERRKVKEEVREGPLRVWVRNGGDDGFSLDDGGDGWIR